MVVAPEAPWPAVNGVRTKLSGLVQGIGLPVDLVAPSEPGDPAGPPGITRTTVAPRSGSLPRLAALTSGRLPISTRLPEAAVVDAVDRLIQAGATYDVVHLDTLATVHLARPLRELTRRRGQRPTIVASLNDSYSLLLASGGLNSRLRPQLYRQYVKRVERRLLPDADYVDVVSEYDAAWLRRLAPQARTRLIPLGVDVEAFDGPRLESRLDVLYLGTMCKEAFHWLRPALTTILPMLRDRFPLIRVGAAGPDATDEALKYFRDHGVTHLGFATDLSELLRSSKMLLVSSRQRAGTPTKALQAMAAGTPVVGMEALSGIPNGRDHRTYSIASDWNDLALRMGRLLAADEYATQVGEGGRRLVRTQHAWPVVRKVYLRFPDRDRPGRPC